MSLRLLLRPLTLTVLTVAMLTAGLIGPAAGEASPVIPETVAKTLHGLPEAASQDQVSAPVTTPIPFSMVGFDVPADADIEFRTAAADGTWGPWTEAEGDADEGPDPGTAEARAARTMTDPVWVGDATRLQTRLTGPAASARPRNVRVELIDSAGLGRSWRQRFVDRLRAAWNGTPPPAAAAPGRPAIVTRKQWGADESLRSGSPYYASKVSLGIVHQTAGSNDYSRAEAPAVLRGIYRYHTQSRGWSDIGYNLLIDRYGTVYEGRYGGVAKAVVGAHAGGFNTGSFGVSLMGSFDTVAPPPAMRQSLEQLLAWKYDVHHLDVTAKTTYTSYGSTRYPAGQEVTLSTLSGHKDVSSTACPGARLYPTLSALRTRIAELQGPVFLDPVAEPTSVQIVNGTAIGGGITFSTRLRPAGAWTLQVRSAQGEVVHTATGVGTEATAQWLPAGAERGTYRYVFSSPQRRAARGTVELTEPAISASASPSVARIGSRGNLPTPIGFEAQLYRGANWELSITDPRGVPVSTTAGTGRSASATWSGPTAGSGTYTWTLAADDVTPVTGTLDLFVNRVRRAGTNPDGPRAAAVISRATFPNGAARHAVLTRSDLPAFALAAAGLAGRNGPLLYTGAGTLPSETFTELQRVLPAGGTVYVVGGPRIIDDAVVAALGTTWTVTRVGGASPVRTAAAAADVVLARSGATSAIVVGHETDAWRGALAAPAYAASRGIPVLLTRPDRLSEATAAALSRNGVSDTVVVGDTRAVSEAVRADLPGSVRASGRGAPGTAVVVAARLFGRTQRGPGHRFIIANTGRADGWVRALAAAPLAARSSAPLLAAGRDGLPTATRRYLRGLVYVTTDLAEATALGNADHLAVSARDALSRHLQ